ncbi:malate dehydrogenase [Acidimicrobiia bacterium]|nr:malate dehydrogenase [Acidimicrobiia bacterium]MDA7850556.1 malate dehydrogenase [Acidimicrobiaceae bacterium]MDA8653425.1 malate dehydrogenase [Candidatus Actinomarina sp.]MDA8667893.1 malate dehydrogenase [Candidatus Actinomarina sp.]MDA8710081.1 malate dehydrogenase [Candidatus Actinomarina sp.]
MKKVTVVGAGKYGSMTALRVAEYNLASEVVMTDIVEGLPQGLALDINQSRFVEKFDTKVSGTNDYKETAESDVVVITAGLPRKPGMSRMDLLEVNAGIVTDVTKQILEHSEDPIIIVVTNPLDQMTTLTAEVSKLSKGRVIGQAGILDSSRFAYFISEKLNVKMSDVYALTLGSHGETMVPVPSLCTVSGEPLVDILSEKDIDELVKKTSEGGAEIVGLLKTGSAYFAPASSAATMVKSIISDSNEVFPVCAWLEGEYGINDVYLGVPAKLGKGGVTEIVEYDLTTTELDALREASKAVKDKVSELNSINSQ